MPRPPVDTRLVPAVASKSKIASAICILLPTARQSSSPLSQRDGDLRRPCSARSGAVAGSSDVLAGCSKQAASNRHHGEHGKQKASCPQPRGILSACRVLPPHRPSVPHSLRFPNPPYHIL